MTGPGPVLAAVDTFHVHVKGVGGHAANPHETRDPIPCAISIIQAVNTIVSRNAYAGDELVVSVTQIHAGSAENVIPDKAYVNGTVRTFDPAVQDLVEARLKEIVAGQAAAFGVEARLDYDRHYPATVNDVAKSEFAAEVARDVSNQVEYREAREMGAEDFSFMLQARPGAFMMLGQGVDSAGLHQPDYDFNDEIAPIGASYFVRLVERAQPVE
jgi:hippurate hydrolase